MSYQLKDGVVEDDHYGLHLVFYKFTIGIRLAKLTTLPESILTRASQVSEALAARARQTESWFEYTYLGRATSFDFTTPRNVEASFRGKYGR